MQGMPSGHDKEGYCLVAAYVLGLLFDDEVDSSMRCRSSGDRFLLVLQIPERNKIKG